jgi:hypothetical protein
MFGSLWQARSPVRTRVTPTLERLETRDCPAAPVIISFGATLGFGNTVTLLGTVVDENPGTVQITFSGVVSGTTMASSRGGFALQTYASALGTIFADAVDEECLSSEQASTSITSDRPVIADFTATDLGDGVYEFSGNVIDESAPGLTVRLTGLAAFGENGLEVTVSWDSWFSVLHNIGSETGTAQAQTWDMWGQESEPVYAIIR